MIRATIKISSIEIEADQDLLPAFVRGTMTFLILGREGPFDALQHSFNVPLTDLEFMGEVWRNDQYAVMLQDKRGLIKRVHRPRRRDLKRMPAPLVLYIFEQRDGAL